MTCSNKKYESKIGRDCSITGKDNKRIAVITNVLPHYRKDFYHRLIEQYGTRIVVFCQANVPGMNLRTVHAELGPQVEVVPAWTLKRERAGWQRLPCKRLMRDFDIYFISGNPRVLSNLIVGTALRLLGRTVVICGQGHTAGASLRSEAIRLWWWRRFKNLFLYTDKCVQSLSEKGFSNRNLIPMQNGLDQHQIQAAIERWSGDRLLSWQRSNRLFDRRILLTCARLEAKNKFDQVIMALPTIMEANTNIVLCIVGDGPESLSLKRLAEALGVANNIRWAGGVYDEEALAPWFLSSSIMVHPSAIGLSLLHAYSYGLPVITHNNNDNQMPEIAAFQDVDGLLRFKENDATDLSQRIICALDLEGGLSNVATRCREMASTQYNTTVMAQQFQLMVKLAT